MISMRFPAKVLGATLIPVTAFFASSCATSPATDPARNATAAPVTSSPFPFPPVKTGWDAAVPLTTQQQQAAETAVRKNILVSDWNPLADSKIPPEILAIVGPENKPAYVPIERLAETGGDTYRVVAVREISSSRWDFDVCRYDTPGVYRMGTNGQLQLSTPHIPYAADTHTVALTTDPNGAGEKSDTPRFLVVDSQPIINDMARQTCEQFRPDPYLQQPPQPLPAGK
ncbi:hypothetical protein FEK33_06300 [Nocardia asteroides NBRC 15531]|uniref:hypothetical protein n=1 Tax=Nocardia asteroides TaxID=1824 RepID=UPI0008E36370|nr:hypothetical protein [Nocardia asteroides]TLF69871.1 hypothetical protein FEK33_06300 [Nocardia asteroides NBRC 15531]UGT49376.1 hypothetical protein LT345_01775 [Nocardia asteroides]SFL88320.1 hypothetical protein SAMN05444423_1011276 [Nocardia asteroides]VEG38146.1 Uncharacterised protein [Nocardia asteroides]